MPSIASKKTRAQDFREETYIPPEQYDIPAEVREEFESRGYHLRWIRVLIDDRDDFKNVAKRRREGYEFVTINEFPPDQQDLYEVKSFGEAAKKYSGVVMIGDLALAKLPIGKAKARQRYYEQMAVNNEKAQRANLSKDSKLNRLLPIKDDSTSTTRTGGRKPSPSLGFGDTLKGPSGSNEEDDE